jgi:hypothetical protein
MEVYKMDGVSSCDGGYKEITSIVMMAKSPINENLGDPEGHGGITLKEILKL